MPKKSTRRSKPRHSRPSKRLRKPSRRTLNFRSSLPSCDGLLAKDAPKCRKAGGGLWGLGINLWGWGAEACDPPMWTEDPEDDENCINQIGKLKNEAFRKVKEMSLNASAHAKKWKQESPQLIEKLNEAYRLRDETKINKITSSINVLKTNLTKHAETIIENLSFIYDKNMRHVVAEYESTNNITGLAEYMVELAEFLSTMKE